MIKLCAMVAIKRVFRMGKAAEVLLLVSMLYTVFVLLPDCAYIHFRTVYIHVVVLGRPVMYDAHNNTVFAHTYALLSDYGEETITMTLLAGQSTVFSVDLYSVSFWKQGSSKLVPRAAVTSTVHMVKRVKRA